MAKTQNIKEEKVAEKSEKEKQFRKEEKVEDLIRIMQADIPGSKKVGVGLTKIKGVSFAMANAICYILKLDKSKRVDALSQEEIDKISEVVKNPAIPTYLKNRRNDFETGEDKHLSVNDLDLQKEFDIKKLKKMKSYKGIRHSRGLPVRGQRTRSHFRVGGKNKVVGVKGKRK
ncbi:MAG: 30S ribosomal protein S13 [Nanoarchaeota archaeon]|nr:30S ribosomal protein S13 [Nanoarchaeota archaeon]